MLMTLSMTTFALLACAAFGAWPLLQSRRVAPVLRGFAGIACVTAGVAMFAAFCVGTAVASDTDDAEVECPASGEKLLGSAPGSSSADADIAEEERTQSPSDQTPESEVADPAAAPAVEEPPAEAPVAEPPAPAPEAEPAEAPSANEPAADEPTAETPAAEASPKGADDIEILSAPEGVVIPPGRPEWVAAAPVHVGDIHTTAVSSGPYARMQDCWRELDVELVKATNAYIAEHLDSPTAPHLLRYDVKEIRSRLLRPQNIYHEQITVSIGPMQQVHGLLEFNPDFRNEIETRWNDVRRYSRLGQLGLGIFAALALLSAMFGYFRVDNATRGRYTGRLQFLTAAAILAVVGVGVVASRFLIWM